MRLKVYSCVSVPTGCTVCYSVNGGAIQQKVYPSGTPLKEIIADIEGKPIAKPDLKAAELARLEAERQKRAEQAQAPKTATEDDLREQDSERDKTVLELNYMRAKLKEAHVKGYQMFKAETVRKKYNELVEQGIIKED